MERYLTAGTLKESPKTAAFNAQPAFDVVKSLDTARSPITSTSSATAKVGLLHDTVPRIQAA
jgi:hypothetical protein